MKVVAGDIGGTNTRLVLADFSQDKTEIIQQLDYINTEFESFYQLLEDFLNHNASEDILAACFAIAGPVDQRVVSLTNYNWKISESEIVKRFHISKVSLINDFAAVCYGLTELKESDLITIQKGVVLNKTQSKPDAIVIGAGTGLGAAHLVWQQDHYQVFTSEAGHAGFSPENELQTELLQWMQKKHSHVSLEMLLSGSGLQIIYRFFHEFLGVPESVTIKELMKISDASQLISEYALSDRDELCRTTLDCFIDIYGAAAGNIALHYYPVDEVFIAGGIAPKIKDKLISQSFTRAFNEKGLMMPNMKKLTIKMVCEEKVGLYGALSQAKKISF